MFIGRISMAKTKMAMNKKDELAKLTRIVYTDIKINQFLAKTIIYLCDMWLIRELIDSPLKGNTKENTDLCYLNPSLLSTSPRLRRSHIIKWDERYNHRSKGVPNKQRNRWQSRMSIVHGDVMAVKIKFCG